MSDVSIISTSRTTIVEVRCHATNFFHKLSAQRLMSVFNPDGAVNFYDPDSRCEPVLMTPRTVWAIIRSETHLRLECMMFGSSIYFLQYIKSYFFMLKWIKNIWIFDSFCLFYLNTGLLISKTNWYSERSVSKILLAVKFIKICLFYLMLNNDKFSYFKTSVL